MFASGATVAHAAALAVGIAHITVPGNTASRGDTSGRLRVVVWYPAPDGTRVTPITVGPPRTPYFVEGEAAQDAPLMASPGRLPFIVVSHGTGGTAMDLSWLCAGLAAHGYIVASVDHPGNNALDPPTVAGVTLWWMRADDLSHVIGGVLKTRKFGTRINDGRIGAAGFSLGGYTALVVAGARGDAQRLRPYCAGHPGTALCTGEATPTVPDLDARARALAASDLAYRAAVAANMRSHRDPRVKAVFSIAPALGPALIRKSLAGINVPVAFVAGFGDPILPVIDNVIPDALAVPNAELTILPKPAGHYTFLTDCTAAGARRFSPICHDSGPFRNSVHRTTLAIAQAFFDRTLASRVKARSAPK